jgi:hypothetical protein
LAATTMAGSAGTSSRRVMNARSSLADSSPPAIRRRVVRRSVGGCQVCPLAAPGRDAAGSRLRRSVAQVRIVGERPGKPAPASSRHSRAAL